MKKIFLTTIAVTVLVAIISLVRADDMGSMSWSGMNMGGMGQTNSPAESTNNASSSVQTYQARGIVEKIAPEMHQATIHNETIPGYMDEMTMDFTVHNTNEFEGVSLGDQITFNVLVSTNDAWIEDIKRTGKTVPMMTNSMPSMGASGTN